MSHTRTFALLDVSPEAYAEIRARLMASGHSDRVRTSGQDDVLDLSGIAVRSEDPARDVKVYLVYRGKMLKEAAKPAESESA